MTSPDDAAARATVEATIQLDRTTYTTLAVHMVNLCLEHKVGEIRGHGWTGRENDAHAAIKEAFDRWLIPAIAALVARVREDVEQDLKQGQRIEELRTVLWNLHAAARRTLNQMICMGGPELCGPCQDRNALAEALEASKAALRADPYAAIRDRRALGTA